MSDNLSRSINNLRNSATLLNEITEKANETIRYVEQFLAEECSVGTSAYTLVDQNEDGVAEYLAYRKEKKNFRIFLIFVDGGIELGSKLWSDCDRDTKLRTIEYLPSLIEGIHEKVEEKIKGAETSINKIAKSLDLE